MMRRDNLVSVDWVADHLKSPNLIVLDASLKCEAGAPQIPGTRHFDFDRKICDQKNPLPHMMPTPELFEREVRLLGVNQDSIVVVYDQTGIYSSPRAWWMFKAMGHDQVAVLNGGLPAWLRAGLPVQTDTHSISTSGNFISTPRMELFCDADHVLLALDDEESVVIDARSQGRFLGNEPEPRDGLSSGHMPNAINMPFTTVLGNGRMLPIEEISSHFKSLVNPDQKLIFSCGSGVTACILAFAASLCGYKDISVYDGSWSEWGRPSALPVVKA